MTYCVALKLSAGLVMLSDTRTNAGVDNVSRFRKMFTWEVPGERAICLMTAGNLSITQGVITRIGAEIKKSEAGDEVETLLNAPSMFRIAQIVGNYMREMQGHHRETLIEQGAGADATILVSGQRAGGGHRLFMVYSAGNFIEAADDTPYFQAGEHKYGKPILDRVITPDTPLRRALKAAFVSMDSTLRSNLSVGMPLDLAMIRANEMKFAIKRRIEADDEEFTQISHLWSDALREAFRSLPEIGED
ncbi:MAG TPA: peptidase [Thermohalobaculum sp.]|nr:peptidase [Thermohalobaculum sp.]